MNPLRVSSEDDCNLSTIGMAVTDECSQKHWDMIGPNGCMGVAASWKAKLKRMYLPCSADLMRCRSLSKRWNSDGI